MNKLEHRKAVSRIRMVHENGTPVSNTAVRFDQTSSKFLFGCGAFDAVDLQKKDLPAAERALLEERMEKWLKLFNYGTLPFYWGRYEPREGEPMENETMKAAQWLKSRGAKVKGHPLCWHTSCADWLMDYPNEVILQKQLDRIHRDVSHFKGTIDMWDVINEVVIMPVFDKYDNAITRICKQYGRIKLVKKVFDAAREENPDATLLINDFNTSQAYEILIEGLLEAGVPISAIGIQSHQHQGYWGLEKLLQVLERYERFGLPIHFTENTFVSGHIMPAHIVDLNDYQIPEWPSTPEGEERQAREAVEMYTTLFEHPLLEAITTWDPVDGCWLGAPSGVMYADNTEKPVYHALYEKIHGDWETHTELVTDADGYVTLEGFKGDYTAAVNGAKVTLTLDGEEKTLTI